MNAAAEGKDALEGEAELVINPLSTCMDEVTSPSCRLEGLVINSLSTLVVEPLSSLHGSSCVPCARLLDGLTSIPWWHEGLSWVGPMDRLPQPACWGRLVINPLSTCRVWAGLLDGLTSLPRWHEGLSGCSCSMQVLIHRSCARRMAVRLWVRVLPRPGGPRMRGPHLRKAAPAAARGGASSAAAMRCSEW